MRWRSRTAYHLNGRGMVGAILFLAAPIGAGGLAAALPDALARANEALYRTAAAGAETTVTWLRVGIGVAAIAFLIGVLMLIVGRYGITETVDAAEPDFRFLHTDAASAATRQATQAAADAGDARRGVAE